MSAPLLEARQLRVTVGDKTIIDHLDLSLAAGERLAILGRNGAGKSTLLSTLAGLRKPAGGAVLLDG
ncbi:MAG: ABC transporter ATP-binding protein [Dechloromonas sp.]|nr:ABC transporter ATP-binding protein [Dechloromonas sp.]